MKKFELIDFLILLCVYIAVSFFPVSLFGLDLVLNFAISFALRLCCCIFIFIYLKRKKLIKKNKFDSRNFLLLLPSFLVCFSNLSFGLITNTLHFNFLTINLLFEILISLTVAISEELLFRLSIFEVFKDKKPIVKILYSALIFALMHLCNYFTTFNPMVFVQIIYTFGVGILFGLMYEYSHSILLTILFHFLFNSLNNNLFEALYFGEMNLMYFIINIIFGIVIGIYCFLIYKFKLSRREK